MSHTDFLTGVRLHHGEDAVALYLRPAFASSLDQVCVSPAHLFKVATLPLPGQYREDDFVVSAAADAQHALALALAGVGAKGRTDLHRAPLHAALMKRSTFDMLVRLGSQEWKDSLDGALQFYDEAVVQARERQDDDPMKGYYEECLRLTGPSFYCPDRDNPRSALETPLPFWFFNRGVSLQDFAAWDHWTSARAMHECANKRRVLFEGLLQLQYVFYGLLALCRFFTPSLRIGDEPNDEQVQQFAELSRLQATC